MKSGDTPEDYLFVALVYAERLIESFVGLLPVVRLDTNKFMVGT